MTERLDEFDRIARATGIDPEAMQAAVGGIEVMDPIRGAMAAAEMLRVAGREFADAWIDNILAAYKDAFGEPFHPSQRR